RQQPHQEQRPEDGADRSGLAALAVHLDAIVGSHAPLRRLIDRHLASRSAGRQRSTSSGALGLRCCGAAIVEEPCAQSVPCVHPVLGPRICTSTVLPICAILPVGAPRPDAPPDRRRTPAMPECFVAKAAELKDGDRRIVVSGKHEVGVFFKDGDYYAYSNYCLHAGGPACEGILVNKVVDIIAPDR